MIPVSRAERTRALDAAVIDQVGVPGQLLMELAGREAADEIAQRWPTASVGILCGPGNNGGDGLVMARWLALWGHEVAIWLPKEPTTADAKANLALCEKLELRILPEDGLGEVDALSDVLVDAMLGTGQSKAPRGAIREGVEMLAAERDRPVVALDLPTGVHADTGAILGKQHQAVSADLTVTFGRLKPGLLAAPGSVLAGEIILVDIGLDLAAIHDPALIEPDAEVLEESDVESWWPHTGPEDAKWDRGHVAVLAGGGAAVLAAHGAFRAGAGLVTVLAPKKAWADFHGLWPEVILAEPETLDAKRHDALVMGPGLGTDDVTGERVRQLWAEFPGHLVADADALTLLATSCPNPTSSGARVITPHSAEAARLLGRTRREVDSDRFTAVADLAKFGVAVLKGPNTLIKGPAGIWVNPTGNAKLATAGSGDVLAGMIGALLARGLGPQSSAGAGVFCHGQGGERMPVDGTASDLIEALRTPK